MRLAIPKAPTIQHSAITLFTGSLLQHFFPPSDGVFKLRETALPSLNDKTLRHNRDHQVAGTRWVMTGGSGRKSVHSP